MPRQLRRLASDSAVYSAAGVVTRLLTFILVPIFTRVFAPADYGVVGLANALLAVVTVFAILGLDSAAGRWFWDTSDTDDRRVTLSTWFFAYLASAVLLAAAMFAAAGAFAGLTSMRNGAGVFRLAALTIPLGVTGVVVNNILRVQRRPWAAAGFALATSLTWLAGAVLFVVVLDHGVPGVYEAQIASGTLATIAGAVVAKRWLRPRWFRVERLRVMLGYALPLVPAALAFWVVNLSDRFFLRGFAGNTEVGLYQVSNAIGAAVALITVGFQQAWGPFAMSIHREPGARDIYARTLAVYAAGSCLVATAVSVFSPEIIRVVATPRYAAASDAVPYLALSYAVLGATYVAAIGANLNKTTKPVALAVLWAAAANTLMNIALVPAFGGVGAGVATLVGWMVMAVTLFRRSQVLYPIPYRFAPASVMLAASLAIALLGESWTPDDLVVAGFGKLGLILLLVPLAFALRMVVPEQLSGLLRDRKGSGA